MVASASPALGELMEGCGSAGLVGVRGAVAAMLATQEVSRVLPPPVSPYSEYVKIQNKSILRFRVYKYLSLSLISIVHSLFFYESHCKPLSCF